MAPFSNPAKEIDNPLAPQSKMKPSTFAQELSKLSKSETLETIATLQRKLDELRSELNASQRENRKLAYQVEVFAQRK
jgi:ribosomal protein L29